MFLHFFWSISAQLKRSTVERRTQSIVDRPMSRPTPACFKTAKLRSFIASRSIIYTSCRLTVGSMTDSPITRHKTGKLTLARLKPKLWSCLDILSSQNPSQRLTVHSSAGCKFHGSTHWESSHRSDSESVCCWAIVESYCTLAHRSYVSMNY